MFLIGETVHFIEVVSNLQVKIYSGTVADLREDGTYEISTKLDNTGEDWATWRTRKTVFATNHEAHNYVHRLNEGST